LSEALMIVARSDRIFRGVGSACAEVGRGLDATGRRKTPRGVQVA
jgi:hypothetical protein